MAFFGTPRGRNKAAATVHLTVTATSGSNNATIQLDTGGITTFTLTAGTWLQLLSAGQVTQTINFIDVNDTTGVTAWLGTGGAGSEVMLELAPPGGNGFIPVLIAAGTRIAYQAPVALSLGELIINFWD